MPTFGERLKEYGRDGGLKQVDLEQITGQSRQRINEYINKGDTPTYTTFQAITAALRSSRDYLAGDEHAEKWGPAIRQLQVVVKDIARTMDPMLDVDVRMQAICRIVQVQLHLPDGDWFLPSVLNIGGRTGGEPGALKNQELFADFMGGRYERASLTWIMRRLSDFTALPREWMELGEVEMLAPSTVDDLGSWSRTFERMRRLGHTPEMYDEYMESIDDLFRRYGAKH